MYFINILKWLLYIIQKFKFHLKSGLDVSLNMMFRDLKCFVRSRFERITRLATPMMAIL